MRLNPVPSTNVASQRTNLKSNTSVSNNKKSEISFKGTDYAIDTPYGRLYLRTSLFREPHVLRYIPEYIKQRFKDKNSVPVHTSACSLGHEPYSLAMLFNNKPGNKKIHLYASDINPTVTNIAKSGILHILPEDIKEAQTVLPDVRKSLMPANTDVYRKYIKSLTDGKILDGEYKNGEFFDVNARSINQNDVYKVTDSIKNSIEKFDSGDLLKQKFDKPCVVMFRNALQHMKPDENRKEFLKTLYKKLPSGSALVVGEGDINRKLAGVQIIQAGFSPHKPGCNEKDYGNKNFISKNLFDPRLYIFEKN